MLTNLISRYLDAKRIWEAQFDEDDVLASNSPEWENYMNLSFEIIAFRCGDFQSLHHKSEFILNDVNLFDIVSNCGGGENLRDLLRSGMVQQPSSLEALIIDYFAKQRAWETKYAGVDFDVAEDPEWTAYGRAERLVLEFPCRTPHDVIAKARFLLEDEEAADTVKSAFKFADTDDDPFEAFLRSLLTCAEVAAGEG